ncbi:MAG: hypothetical protein ACXQTE_01320 [Methanosarcinaceae archaeon]
MNMLELEAEHRRRMNERCSDSKSIDQFNRDGWPYIQIVRIDEVID